MGQVGTQNLRYFIRNECKRFRRVVMLRERKIQTPPHETIVTILGIYFIALFDFSFLWHKTLRNLFHSIPGKITKISSTELPHIASKTQKLQEKILKITSKIVKKS